MGIGSEVNEGVLATAGARRVGSGKLGSVAGAHPASLVARPAQSGNRLLHLKEGFAAVFDGSSIDDWQMAGSGHFVIVHDRLESVPGDDVGLFWCTVPTPPDFILRLEWLRWRHEDASGVFLRLPQPVGGSGSAALAAMRQAFEVQIDEVGIPGATAIHKTGAIFNEPNQLLTPHPAHAAAAWNEFEITAKDQEYSVRLNGRLVTRFVNADEARGRASSPGAPSFIGLQMQPGSRIAFRSIRIKAL